MAALAAAWLLGTGVLPGRQTASAPEGQVSVEPRAVVAGLFYEGASIHVDATVPPGAAVAVLCRGADAPLLLKKKGKALGLLWMNVGDASWEEIPELYLLRSSAALDRLAPAGELERLGIGFPALRTRARPGPGADSLFGELVQLKERDGLWAIATDGVELRAGAEAVAAVTELPLPVKAPPGTYRILVYAFLDGRGELAGSGEVEVRQGGVPALIASLAKEHGLLYGVVAVVVAVAVGLLTGVVFGLGSRKGH
jgi:hypothetical protein